MLGATVNPFTSVSLDPPPVLVSLIKTAKAVALLADKPFRRLEWRRVAITSQAGHPESTVLSTWVLRRRTKIRVSTTR